VRPRILIRDNDKNWRGGHDRVFQSEGVRVIRTPIHAPNANAYAERWVRIVREECLNHLLILNEKHLRRVLQTFIHDCSTARPHQGLDQAMPVPRQEVTITGPVQRRDVLGFIRDYYRGPDPTIICLA
jgi:putative transposase